MNGKTLANKFKLFFIILITCLGFTLTTNILANQNTALPTKSYQSSWWINLGIGKGVGAVNHDISDELALNASLNYIVAPHILLTVQALNRNDVFFSDFTQYSALLSYIKKQPHWYVSVGAGLGVDQADTRFDFIIRTGPPKYYLSVPAQIQAFYTPSKYVGIGVILTGTATSQYILGTAMLAIQFGNLLA